MSDQNEPCSCDESLRLRKRVKELDEELNGKLCPCTWECRDWDGGPFGPCCTDCMNTGRAEPGLRDELEMMKQSAEKADNYISSLENQHNIVTQQNRELRERVAELEQAYQNACILIDALLDEKKRPFVKGSIELDDFREDRRELKGDTE